MATITRLKRGDTAPLFTATLLDRNGVAVDLAGAAARFLMRAASFPREVKVDAVATILAPASAGRVQYAWLAADTDTPGAYDAEVEITFGTGEVESFPNDSHSRVIILDDLD